MAHEAVNADTEEVWHSREIRHRRVPAQVLREADDGQGHHGSESQPPHERGEYLKVNSIALLKSQQTFQQFL